MILSNSDIRDYIKRKRLIIKPLSKDTIRENGIDLRISREIAHFKRTKKIYDVRDKATKPNDFYKKEKADSFIIHPHERILVSTLETVGLEDDLMGFVNLRSTYARMGLMIPPTIIDAGFKGQLTLEVMGGPFPVKVYAGDRFCHAVLAKLTSKSIRYRGTYQGQKGVTYARF